MEPLYYSFVIPVYNRPDEIDELLESFTKLKGNLNYEIIIVEDGSNLTCENVIGTYKLKLNISYFYKENSGPGDSRNFGMKHAKGNYFIILDSDCLLPENYLEVVNRNLTNNFVDCFGGPDAAHESFSILQKAINFAMTSFITTGGIRGNRKAQKNFQPRSFNMGLSKKAFEQSKGFGVIHPGEDPDLSIRLSQLGFKTALFNDAFVYHKRRISWSKFYNQVFKFGMVRPILNQWHPGTKRFIYWLPTFFILGFLLSLLLLIYHIKIPIALYLLYFFTAFVVALFKTKNFLVAISSVIAIFVQFLGYGYGFLKSTFMLKLSNKPVQSQFPNLFFTHGK